MPPQLLWLWSDGQLRTAIRVAAAVEFCGTFSAGRIAAPNVLAPMSGSEGDSEKLIEL